MLQQMTLIDLGLAILALATTARTLYDYNMQKEIPGWWWVFWATCYTVFWYHLAR